MLSSRRGASTIQRRTMTLDYTRVATAIGYIHDHVRDQPRLDQIAAKLHLSPFHFQRLFRRWAGVTPKQFLQFLTVEYAKQALERSNNVIETAYDLGLSGPARLHDHFVSLEAVT